MHSKTISMNKCSLGNYISISFYYFWAPLENVVQKQMRIPGCTKSLFSISIMTRLHIIIVEAPVEQLAT